MKKHPFLFLGIAIAVALVVYAVERPERPRTGDASEAMLIPGFDSANIARVEVAQLLDGAELRRDGDGWLVADLVTPMRKELFKKEGRELPAQQWRPADRQRVMSALGMFGGLEEGLIVSDNPNKQSLYQVDTAGLSVRGFDTADKKIFDVVIGKNGPDIMGTYLRRAGEDAVWLVERPLVGAFTPHADDWAKKEPAPAPQPE